MHRNFFGDDDDFFDIGIDANQFGDAVAHCGRRQVDHADVELVTGFHAFAHVVVHGDTACGRLDDLPTATGGSAEHDVAAGIGVADRGHGTGFVAGDVQHADAVFARRNIGQRTDADEVFKV